MATTRFGMRLDEETKAKAEKTSALLGMKSQTGHVAKLMGEDAIQWCLPRFLSCLCGSE